MKRLASSLIAAAAVLPMFWFAIKPDGAEFCARSSSYFRSTMGTIDRAAKLKFSANKNPVNEFCKTVASYPM